jgi:hypothetical protein
MELIEKCFQDSWDYDMVSLTDLPMEMPPSFLGRWRMNAEWEYELDGKVGTDCMRFYADVAEV